MEQIPMDEATGTGMIRQVQRTVPMFLRLRAWRSNVVAPGGLRHVKEVRRRSSRTPWLLFRGIDL